MISTKHFDSPLYELESMENYESVVYFTLRSFTKSLHHAAMKNISSPPGLINISRINFVCILKNLWLIAFANAFLSLNILTISTPPQIFISFMEWWVNFFFYASFSWDQRFFLPCFKVKQLLRGSSYISWLELLLLTVSSTCDMARVLFFIVSVFKDSSCM